ncbi:MAG: ABC transporter ATP-binding protein [Verrucomicrobia bacterium]|nr:MAG: ABC transporter ATP-binding protein [Verrucomicrobiota bacterium]
MKQIIQVLSELVGCLVRLRRHLRLGRWLLLGVLLCNLLSAPLEVAGVGLLLPMLSFLQGEGRKLLVGGMLHRLAEWFPNQTDAFYFKLFCGLIVVAIGLKNVTQFVSANLGARMMSRGAVNLRRGLYDRLQAAPLHIFESHKAGEISSVFTVETVRTMNAVDFLFGFIQRLTMALFLGGYIVYTSWAVALSFVVLVALIALLTGRIHRGLEVQGNQRGELFRSLAGTLVEAFAGMRVIRATHARGEITERYDEASTAIGRTERRGSFYNSILAPLTETAGIAGAMVILIGTYHFLIVPGHLAPVKLMLLGFLLIRLLPLVNQLHGFTGQLSYNLAGVREVEKWLNVPQYPLRPFGDRPMEAIRSELRFDAVTFRYPNGTLALDGVSFSVPAGHTVAVVGASGSGKSTLASVLIRLREATSGSIRIDGMDHWEFSPETWHRRLGVVEQEAFLFHESVRRNICLGHPQASDAEIASAVRMARLDDVVTALPNGLESVVGERGTSLSGGQRQRLAIARAMVRQPLLLVLDEATSALDNISERQVQAALDQARQGRTTLVIAHRLSTVRSADTIVVLDHGRVVQQGTWASLETAEGPFRRLVAAARDGHLAGEAT